ncbi:hypothetical protein F444_16910 [Phytophthora nicotianae P1976]|uniref:Uncharacterized protein n=1 Tax=Phytophthora nicotianae P1976 TaxID=1317066 RepID=A0A080ZGQ9_PHYNI|nr:hypothetical protein F444_16910 [Phytophthora nicotianae P1976]
MAKSGLRLAAPPFCSVLRHVPDDYSATEPWAQQRDLIDEIITIAQLLCSQGSKPKTSGACLRNHTGELLAVLEYRHKCYLLLMLIPSEVIKAEKPPSPFT